MDDLTRLYTPEQGLTWIDFQIAKMEEARVRLDVAGAPKSSLKMRDLKKLESVFWARHGGCMMGLEVLKLCGMLPQHAYLPLMERINKTAIPTIGATLRGRF